MITIILGFTCTTKKRCNNGLNEFYANLNPSQLDEYFKRIHNDTEDVNRKEALKTKVAHFDCQET